jgi:hypothetical protein
MIAPEIREKAFQFGRPIITSQHLERDEPIQLSLPRPIYDTHPAASQFSLDLVAADDSAPLGGQRRCWIGRNGIRISQSSGSLLIFAMRLKLR